MSVFKSDCADRATVDVRVVTSFPTTLIRPGTKTACWTCPRWTSRAAVGQDLIIVRLWYRQPMIVPALTQAVSSADPDRS
jgi:hypothetical protein